MSKQPTIKLSPAEFRSILSDRDKLRRALTDIGNLAGGPTMRYARDIALDQLHERMEKIVEIVINVLGFKDGKDTPP